MKKLLLPTLAIALLAGCATGHPAAVSSDGSGIQASASDSVDMIARLEVTGQDGYRLMATQTAYNLADVDHVTLTLYRGGAAIATKTIAKDPATGVLATAPVTLQNLKMATSYKVVATAWQAADESVAANRIDTGSDADNAVTFTTPSLTAGGTVNSASGDSIDTDARTIAVKVKLKDKVYNGRAESASGVTVTNGTIVDNGNPETF